jgi:hypothetical protein
MSMLSVLAVGVAIAALGCGTGPGAGDGAGAGAQDTGRISVALTSSMNGTTYALANATFDVRRLQPPPAPTTAASPSCPLRTRSRAT